MVVENSTMCSILIIRHFHSVVTPQTGQKSTFALSWICMRRHCMVTLLHLTVWTHRSF